MSTIKTDANKKIVNDCFDRIRSLVKKNIDPDWNMVTVLHREPEYYKVFIISSDIKLEVRVDGCKLQYNGEKMVHDSSNETKLPLVIANLLCMNSAYQTFINTKKLIKLKKEISDHHKFISDQIEFSPNGVQADLLKEDFEKLSLDQKPEQTLESKQVQDKEHVEVNDN